MSATRILYVTSEIEPFLKISDLADFVRDLPQAMQEKGMEIRILMPRFGVINERKNRLHEVVRLSGINIPVGSEEHPLIIKVASIPSAKLQVYFIDNEDYFKRKSVFHDKNEKWHVDNEERSIFFCKGVLETIKKLGWAPDIIHCNDWMSGLIPLYLKTTYKDEPMFKDSKIVFSISDYDLEEKITDGIANKALCHDLEAADMDFLCDGYKGFIKLGSSRADLILDGTTDNTSLSSIIGENNVTVTSIEKNDNEFENYFEMYNNLLSK
jgi:starch synthase